MVDSSSLFVYMCFSTNVRKVAHLIFLINVTNAIRTIYLLSCTWINNIYCQMAYHSQQSDAIHYQNICLVYLGIPTHMHTKAQ